MIKSYKIELKGVSRRVDRSMSLKCESIMELTSDDMRDLDSLIGSIGLIVLTDDKAGLNEKDNKDIEESIRLMPQRDLLEGKSLSQQLRNVLWVKLKQDLQRDPTTQEFAKYYEEKMTYIIDKIKDSLE